MSKLLLLFFIFCVYSAIAQVPEPAMLWMKVIGGNGGDIVLTPVSKTSDNGFILSFLSTSTSGPISSRPSKSHFEFRQ